MQHLLKHNFDATNYNAPQVSKDYIVQQQADWAQPRRVMKPLPGRLPASNRAMKRYIRCNVVYLWALWLVCTTRAASLLLDLSSGCLNHQSPHCCRRRAGDDWLHGGDTLWCPVWGFALRFNAPGFYSIHPFENRICSADARTVLFVFCFCVASLVTEKTWRN